MEWIMTTHDFDSKTTSQSPVKLTAQETEWIDGCGINDSTAGTTKELEQIEGCEDDGSTADSEIEEVKEVVVIEDDSEQCEMSEEEALVIWHKLKNAIHGLLMSFRRLKEHLAETGMRFKKQ